MPEENNKNIFFKVTPFTKIIALTLFITIPVATFVFGYLLAENQASDLDRKKNVRVPIMDTSPKDSNIPVTSTPTLETTPYEDSATSTNISIPHVIASPYYDEFYFSSKYSIKTNVPTNESEKTRLFIYSRDQKNRYYAEYDLGIIEFIEDIFWLDEDSFLISVKLPYDPDRGSPDTEVYKVTIDTERELNEIEKIDMIKNSLVHPNENYIDFKQFNSTKTHFYLLQQCETCAPDRGIAIKIFDMNFKLVASVTNVDIYNQGLGDNIAEPIEWVDNKRVKYEIIKYSENGPLGGVETVGTEYLEVK